MLKLREKETPQRAHSVHRKYTKNTEPIIASGVIFRDICSSCAPHFLFPGLLFSSLTHRAHKKHAKDAKTLLSTQPTEVCTVHSQRWSRSQNSASVFCCSSLAADSHSSSLSTTALQQPAHSQTKESGC